jgi:hypothetical protein
MMISRKILIGLMPALIAAAMRAGKEKYCNSLMKAR